MNAEYDSADVDWRETALTLQAELMWAKAAYEGASMDRDHALAVIKRVKDAAFDGLEDNDGDLTVEAVEQAARAARIGEQKALEVLIQDSAFTDEDGLYAITPESGEEIAHQLFLAGYRRAPEPREVTTREEMDALIAESRALSLGHLLAALRLIPLGETVQGCVRSDGQQTRDAVKASFRLNRKLADALESAEASAELAQEMINAQIERGNALAADLGLARLALYHASTPRSSQPLDNDQSRPIAARIGLVLGGTSP